MPTDWIHPLVDVVTPVVLGILAYVTLMNRVERAKSQAELLQSVNSIKEDFNEKHAENTQNIAVHQAEDLQKFEAISRTLVRLDSKLDKMADRRA